VFAQPALTATETPKFKPAHRALLRWGLVSLQVPATLFLLLVYALPVGQMLLSSFQNPGWTLTHYTRVFQDPFLWSVLLGTFRLATEVTLLCLVLGYPVAYLMLRSSERMRQIITILIILPVWTSVLVRAYAWIVLLGRNGVFNQVLLTSDIVSQPLPMLYNRFGVYIGMVHIMLPFLILPLYAVMQRIDLRVVDAALSLGASPTAAFLLTFFPLSMPGIAAGSLLVFILSLGFFVTPALLGGLRDVTYVMLIERRVVEFLNWELASAMAIVLLATTLAFVLVYTRVVDFGGSSAPNGYSVVGSWLVQAVARTFGKCRKTLGSWNRIPRLSSLRRSRKRFSIWVQVVSWTVIAFLIMPITIFFPLSLSAAPYLEFPPRAYSLRWYENYFSRLDWIGPTIVSLEAALATTVIATVLGTLAAIALVRGRFRWKALTAGLLISPTIVPTLIIAIALYFQFSKLHLVGTLTGLVLAHVVIALPLVIVVVMGALQSVDEGPERAARSLGARPLTAFLRITLPLIRPGVMTAAFFAFLASFDDVVMALFLSGTSATTLPKRMWEGIRFEIDPTIAAVSVLMILISLALLGMSEFVAYRARRLQRKAAMNIQ
jgi:putative spermidine/putrescine transport system permease protein